MASVSIAEKKRRIRTALSGLGISFARLEAAILLLGDDEEPSRIRTMSRLGFRLSDGVTNRQLLDGVAEITGESKIDRESRDYVQLPLREVGILSIATAEPTEERFIPNYWRSKSPNCVYVLEPEFRALLRCPAAEFDRRIDDWLAGTATRKARQATAEAAALASHEGERLVPLTRKLYCPVFLPDYEVVYVDDGDGERIGTEFKTAVDRLRLPLNLASRWPDIILHSRRIGIFWIVDCVESDGEVDYVRRDEIAAAFHAEGHTIAGYTTAYRNLQKFAQRQRTYDNVAGQTYVWIAEIGGAHWKKELSPQDEEPE